ncbi:MAG: hypothetical protein U0992_07280 [Planctomycetaceae bacterium]
MPAQQRLSSFISGCCLPVNRLRRRFLAVLPLLVLHVAPALAQQPAGGSQIVVQERVPYVESLVAAALCGAAIFAVCRSSRRN